jgi:hypothetical protein
MRTRKINPKNPVVLGAQCPSCRTVVVSASHHDYHSCPCGEIAIDGGREYYRGAFKDRPPKCCRIELIGVNFNNISQESYLPNKDRVLTTISTKLPLVPTRFNYTLDKKGHFRRYRKS